MKKIEYQTSEIFYEVRGEGVPIVFIHGFCEDHLVWQEWIDPFERDYKIILPDLPGFGKSVLPQNENPSISLYADVVKEMLAAEKISSCLMIGHSMGGYVTMNFASRFPEYLKAIGLFHSTSLADDEAKKQDRIRVAEFVNKNGAAPFVSELYNKLFAANYFASHQKEIDELKRYNAEISSVEGIAFASLAMGDRTDTTKTLAPLNKPVLFIIGKEDNIASPEKTLPLTHIPDCSVICLLNDVGHMGMFENVDETRKAVSQLLDVMN